MCLSENGNSVIFSSPQLYWPQKLRNLELWSTYSVVYIVVRAATSCPFIVCFCPKLSHVSYALSSPTFLSYQSFQVLPSFTVCGFFCFSFLPFVEIKDARPPCSLWWFLVPSVHFATSVPFSTPSRRANPLGISVCIVCEISERDQVLVWGGPILQLVCSGWVLGQQRTGWSGDGCHLLSSNVSPRTFAEGEAGEVLLRKHSEHHTELIPALVLPQHTSVLHRFEVARGGRFWRRF